MEGVTLLRTAERAVALTAPPPPVDVDDKPSHVAIPDKPVQEPVPGEQHARHLMQQNLQAQFVFDHELRQVIITLMRQDTGEVVRQIPQEQTRHFLASLMEMTGRHFDGRA